MREMENYIHPNLINEKFGIELSKDLSEWVTFDISQFLKDKVKLDMQDIAQRKKLYSLY
ncbi:hypothetical protein OXPF_36640 [Oxobacter pfennigii]|uniref:Uncharacterized protein n=1 Tax=Oxobacter pfennigii TaxID=36849 RepID=A0A0N8NST1_9CLOT|nr:hypothetical protein [Oxobacter pfennigii]KPU42896.1 hypothetical protein OXPF_36640 [Oxobacter pfennigii]